MRLPRPQPARPWQVDLLSVGRAALSAGAPFTALQYVEAWCEAAHGRLSLFPADSPDAPLSAEGPLPHHLALLLDAAAAADEPDGIYGALRMPHAAVQARRQGPAP